MKCDNVGGSCQIHGGFVGPKCPHCYNPPVTDYPLVKAIGLRIIPGLNPCLNPYVEANDLERALEKAPVVTFREKPLPADETCGFVTMYNMGDDLSKWRARLIGLEPIKKETAEDLLREIVNDGILQSRGAWYCEWLDRARRILSGG